LSRVEVSASVIGLYVFVLSPLVYYTTRLICYWSRRVLCHNIVVSQCQSVGFLSNSSFKLTSVANPSDRWLLSSVRSVIRAGRNGSFLHTR